MLPLNSLLKRIVPVLAACALGGPLVAQTKQPAAKPTVKPKALAKLAEPWPDADTLHARRADAETRRLFAGDDPVALSLSADFKTINKDRSVEGKKRYPAVITVTGEEGPHGTLHATLRTRGHFRLRATSCTFVPLRVEFDDKDEVTGTLFDHQKTLKLVTHCQTDKEYEQYVMREYLVYRVLNLLTPRSFRARLARVTYVQSTNGQPIITRRGMFLEEDDDVARRLEGRVMDLERLLFKDVDQETLTLTTMFEYMIGNTDYSIYKLHNIRLINTPGRVVYTVPYDFDLSGLVNTSYAIADRSFGLRSVRDRLYRGPCRTLDDLQPVLDQFKTHKTEVLGLYDSLPDLDAGYRREAKGYLEEFYRSLDRSGDVKHAFIDGQCSTKPTM
jgi:hypothetical protein